MSTPGTPLQTPPEPNRAPDIAPDLSRPPIPLPVAPPAPAFGTVYIGAASPGAFYGAIVAASVVVFAVLWGLSLGAGALPVLLATWAANAFVLVRGTLQVRRLGASLGWRVRDQAQFEAARAVIDSNMKVAAATIALIFPLLGLAFLSVPAFALATLAFSVPFGVWSSRVESRFRAMTVPDEALRHRFAAACRAWKEARWSLPPEI
jgi:hypothetical protein